MYEERCPTYLVVHVVRELVEIVGAQIVVILALADDLGRKILLLKHLPERDGRVIGTDDVPDHFAGDVS